MTRASAGRPYRRGYRTHVWVVLAGMLAALTLVLMSTTAMGQSAPGDSTADPEGSRPSPAAEAPEEAGGAERKVDEDPQGNPYAAGELLVGYEDTAPEQATEEVPEEAGAEVEEEISEIEAQLVSFPEVQGEGSRESRERELEEKKEEIEQDPAVEAVAYNYLRKPAWTPNDPYLDYLWGFEKIQNDRAWDTARGQGVKVAVVDSGIDYYHPEFYGKVAAEYDFVNRYPYADDYDGHGTHVAGTIAANTDNGEGVSGTCPDCRLIVARAIGYDGGYDSDIADAIVWSADSGAKVINLSLGGPGKNAVLENDGNSTISYPAAYPRAIAVAATTSADGRASYSNYGGWVDVAAPGSSILSTDLYSSYRYASGTSMASPHVAGVAGLLAGKGLSNAQIRQRIERTAVDKGKVGKDPAFGWGRINAFSTVNGETAPTISNPRPAPGAKTRDRTPTMSATVRDKRTELKKENISLFVNGSRVTSFTYNAKIDRLSFTPKKNMALRKHSVKIVARDAAGITKVSAWKFSVVR